MSNRHTPETLTAMENDISKLVGEESFKALKAEFVDLINDLRVASVNEIIDLGISRKVARDVLYYVQRIASQADPTCKQKVTEITIDEEVEEMEEVTCDA